MRTEWRGNIWLLVEFLLISLIIWYVCVNLYGLYLRYNPSKGYDFNNIYVASVGYLSPDVPSFIQYPDDEIYDAYRRDFDNIINRIRQHPAVEVVGAGHNAVPYNYSYNGIQLAAVDGTDTLYYQANHRIMDANVMRALKVQGANGESTEQLIEILEDGKVLISTFDDAAAETNEVDMGLPERLAGKKMFDGQSSVDVAPALINNMRRNDYESAWGGLLVRMPSPQSTTGSLIIRIRPGMDREFCEWIQNERLRAGNIYIANTESLKHQREATEQPYETIILRMSIILVFMITLVFLGFLGTYWFRIQERVPEIAIRKAMGATNFRVGSRLWAEGFIIMGITVELFVPLMVWFIHSDYFGQLIGGLPQRGYYAIAITVVILALLVLAGIYFPARRAMKINPAIALKEQ